ncbi:hypothetical protein [Shinella zoogloeoides]|uniref:hypothetical protein n=1 Tax=Shinella zoogloeoides TaxID=352475 RepID=UPI0013C2CB3C|nr:hypothetical protein [Shinella zoogloeoides]
MADALSACFGERERICRRAAAGATIHTMNILSHYAIRNLPGRIRLQRNVTCLFIDDYAYSCVLTRNRA